MGLIGNLFKGIGKIISSPIGKTIGGVVLGEAAFSAIESAVGEGTQTPVQKALATAGAGATVLRTIQPGAGTGSVNQNTVITRVMTISPAGKIVKQEDLVGRPFLMNKDLVTAKRVFRMIRKADQRLPRKSVGRRGSKDKDIIVIDGHGRPCDSHGNVIVKT